VQPGWPVPTFGHPARLEQQFTVQTFWTPVERERETKSVCVSLLFCRRHFSLGAHKRYRNWCFRGGAGLNLLAAAAAWREFEAFFVAFRRAIDFYVNNAIICLKFSEANIISEKLQDNFGSWKIWSHLFWAVTYGSSKKRSKRVRELSTTFSFLAKQQLQRTCLNFAQAELFQQCSSQATVSPEIYTAVPVNVQQHSTSVYFQEVRWAVLSKNLSRALFLCQVLPYDFKKYFSAELVVRAKLKFHQILLPVFFFNCPGVFDSIRLIKETEEKSENHEQIWLC